MTQFYPTDMDFLVADYPVDDICAAEWATYKQALHAVIDLDPARLSMETFDYPVTLLDEAALALMNTAWDAAIQAGQARAANLGVAIPQRVCPRCHGAGRLWNGSGPQHIGAEETIFPVCAGEGTVWAIGGSG